MTAKTEYLMDKYYRSNPQWENGTKEYHDFLQEPMGNDSYIALEIGPGPTNPSSTFMAERVNRLDGLDIDPRSKGNTSLGKAMIYDGSIFPIEDDSYNIVVADYVMEHVENPELMFSEIKRVLKKDGYFIFRTPNLMHYVNLISKFSPHKFHLAVANKARNIPGNVDPYPTFYRCNRKSRIEALCKHAGMQVETLKFIEKEPSYLKFNSVLFRLGVAYERVVNSTSKLNGMRSNIFCVIKNG